MPTFVFTDPSGKKHRVTGPPGATQEQAFQILQQSLGGGGAPPAPPPEPDPTEGMSYGQKALANIGAGMSSTWEGAKGLVGMGMSDEELQAKRKRDKALADATFGGGVLQTVGEIAPTIPLGLAGRGLAMAMGGRAAAAAANPILSAAGGGAMGGALMPVTSDESRLANVGLGAVGGAIAPPIVKGAVKVARGAGEVGERLASALPGALGARAAERQGTRQAEKYLAKELPGGVAAQDVYTPHPSLTAAGYRPTAAVAMQDPAVAGVERASRIKNPELWMDPDEAAHGARWQALDRNLQTQADVDRLIGEADVVGREVGDVYAAVGPAKFDREMDKFFNALQAAKTTNVYHANSSVRDAVDYVEDTMRKAGTVTPELVHLMKRELGGGLKGRPGVGDAAVRAAASEPKILDLMKSLDNVLENATKGRYETQGKYGAWKERYAHAAGQTESAKADVNLRAKFIDPATGMLKKPATAGGEPVVTGGGLRQAVAQAGSMKRGPRKGQNLLSPSSQTAIEAVARDLDMADIIRRSKAASTGGGGSDTASNLQRALLMEMASPFPGAGGLRLAFGEGGRKGQEAMQRQIAALVQDPVRLRRFLANAERQRLLRGQMPGMAPGIGAAIPLMLGGPER